MATTKRQRLLFIVASLCIVALLVNYRNIGWFNPPDPIQPTPAEEEVPIQPSPISNSPQTIFNDTAMQKEIFKGILNNRQGNICLIGLQGNVLNEWLNYIHNINKSLFKIFVIGSVDKNSINSNEVQVFNGTFKEALANFVFDQKLHECDFIHFGDLASEDQWEAAWMASRMVIKNQATAIWSKEYAYNRTGIFTHQRCMDRFCTGFVRKINFGNRDDIALQIQYAKHIPKEGYSFNFFAYNPNPTKLQNAFKEALTSARTYRKNHPKGGKVDLILFTSDRNFVDTEGVFDRIVGIKSEFMFNNERQWTTRVIFSSFAPARISLFVDADSYSCLPMVSFFEFMDSHEFDFTINGHWPHDMIIPDCGAYAWKWSEKTRKLMAQWFDEFGSEMSGDDQARLYRAMEKLKTEVTIGRTRSTHALRFAPGDGETWGPDRRHQQTQILYGPAHLIHARETHVGVCSVLNQFNDTKRVFVCKSTFTFDISLSDEEKANKLIECLHPVFNQTACNNELDNTCFKTNDWNANPDVIVHAPDFYVPPPKSAPTAQRNGGG